MPSLCNSTLSSSPDRDDCQYWTSFSEKPFSSGPRLQVYKGKLNGKGPRGGEFSVVKIFVDQPGTETRCLMEIVKANTASDLLQHFLAQGGYNRERVKSTQLQMAPMDQVSMLNKLFAHNKRRPSAGEWILLEEMIQDKGDLVQFVDSNGKIQWGKTDSRLNRGSRRGCSFSSSDLRWSVENQELLEAFVHYTYSNSDGQLVVCGLEGLEDEQGRLILKTPVIHSLDMRYGETDLGQQGIEQVMGHHHCKIHCQRILNCRSRVPSQNISRPLTRRSSAPPDFPVRQQQGHSVAPDPIDDFLRHPVRERHISLPSAPPYELEDVNGNGSQLSLNIFAYHEQEMEDQKLLFLFGINGMRIPDDPPPPYTEFNNNVLQN